jgi:hypothetical protein
LRLHLHGILLGWVSTRYGIDMIAVPVRRISSPMLAGLCREDPAVS